MALFNSREIRPGFLVLDDGWQNIHIENMPDRLYWEGKLTSFGPKGNFFEDSDVKNLKELIAKVKREHGIGAFLVWHALTGYWRGVHILEESEGGTNSTSGEDMKQFNPEMAHPRLSNAEYRGSAKARGLYNRISWDPHEVSLISPKLIEEFFAAYHASLAEMGVDGVKVDVQGMLPSLVSSCQQGGIHLASTYHLALQKSVGTSFSKANNGEITFPLINSMAHSQGILMTIAAMYPDLQEDASTHLLRPLIRGSDDFWPRILPAQGPHIFVNTLNSLLMSEIGLHDWDMFASNIGPSSEMHAASRAISGGPVCTSDAAGTQNDEIYRRLAFPDGTIPRCIRNARPVSRVLFDDPQRVAGTPLMIQSANADGFVVGVFSIAGSVIENDSDSFRTLRVSEMTWPEGFTVPPLVQSESPVWEQPELIPALGVECEVFLNDVEEFASTGGYPHVVAFKHSDHSVVTNLNTGNLITAADISVAIQIPHVFGFDIVTFAKIHTLNHVSSRKSLWVSAVGAVDLYNPGGAVLRFDSTSIDDAIGGLGETSFSFDLLGSGRYLFVSNTPLEIMSAIQLDCSGQFVGEVTKSTEALVSKNFATSLFHTVVTIVKSLDNLHSAQWTRLEMRTPTA